MDVPFDELVSHQLKRKLRVWPVSRDASSPHIHKSPDSVPSRTNQLQRVVDAGALDAGALPLNQPVENELSNGHNRTDVSPEHREH